MKTLLYGLVLAVLVVACGRAPSSGMTSQLAAAADSPAEFGTVGEFSFTERGGEQVANTDLLGEVWIVGFFFSRCAGPCPKLSKNMSDAQELLAESGVRLVSISVDPNYDTPAVLLEYATHYTDGTDRWLFLSGDEQATFDLMRESFYLGVEKMPGEDVVAAMQFTHATQLVVVDRDGLIRGYYDGESADQVAAAVARARWLDENSDRSAPSSRLPLLNACLNGTAVLLLLAGLLAIKAGYKKRHALLMRTAFVVSMLFLASYVNYHFVVLPGRGPVQYNGTGVAHAIYIYVVLLPHILGAVINLPLVLATLWLAHKQRWTAHKRLARLTYPLWMYVSLSGVVVYLMLYPFNPPA